MLREGCLALPPFRGWRSRRRSRRPGRKEGGKEGGKMGEEEAELKKEKLMTNESMSGVHKTHQNAH